MEGEEERTLDKSCPVKKIQKCIIIVVYVCVLVCLSVCVTVCMYVSIFWVQVCTCWCVFCIVSNVCVLYLCK